MRGAAYSRRDDPLAISRFVLSPLLIGGRHAEEFETRGSRFTFTK